VGIKGLSNQQARKAGGIDFNNRWIFSLNHVAPPGLGRNFWNF
jgi:hypothetical protein